MRHSQLDLVTRRDGRQLRVEPIAADGQGRSTDRAAKDVRRSRGITGERRRFGFVDTDANAGWLRGNPEAEAHAAGRAALGRVGQPADIADVVAFLASDDSRWITGQLVDATGVADL